MGEENKTPKEKPSFSPANLSVVITNLPEHTTLAQISAFCRKVGVLATHPETGEDLILYNPRLNKATVTYYYPEGANNAIKLLSGEQFVDKHPVQVERAKREPFNFSLWKTAMHKQRKFHAYLGDHTEELSNSEQKRLKVMVMRKVFTPKELIQSPELYGKIIADITAICSKFGKVTLVKPIEAHPEGVVIVRFDDPQATALAIGELDDVEYRGRHVTTEPWDGTDLSVRETQEEEDQRILMYERFIDQENNPESNENNENK
ncbi:putative nuclear mRNA splicing factor-associated protein [Histomonas meleagridis]|uniref:putative nuclear mRNA splicing factor-associated protein n=1 Tax=Histomonas meleagridis TaxID=135588 RepID=UPI003559596D|nr:putative nuclear mRNA splicing factor-associated protein [Histomonas meleagridis]KAH0805021.1 putative nuclear mRNA splicing factor-associated protein [Histomonas meleagridis]